jgi:hypothetical protein
VDVSCREFDDPALHDVGAVPVVPRQEEELSGVKTSADPTVQNAPASARGKGRYDRGWTQVRVHVHLQARTGDMNRGADKGRATSHPPLLEMQPTA